MNLNTRSSHLWDKPPREQYAKNIIGKKFHIVHPIQLLPNDRVVDLQCPHIGYEKIKTIDTIQQIGEFYEIQFKGEATQAMSKFAHTCLFAKHID